MFVVMVMLIVLGVVVECMKLWVFFVFVVVMIGFIYLMEGVWIWGGEVVFGMYMFGDEGFFDFVGLGIVYMVGVVVVLVGVFVFGVCKGKYIVDGKVNVISGVNLFLVILGIFIFWMGWFGFNGGFVFVMVIVESVNLVVIVFMNINVVVVGGIIVVFIVVCIMFGKVDLIMVLNGVFVGLVVIIVEFLILIFFEVILFGGLGGIFVVLSIVIFDKFKIDDLVGVIFVYGVVGFLGLILVFFINFGLSIIG